MIERIAETCLMFAYGSNMLTNRIRQRCPSATALGVAELVRYELRWHKRSTDRSAKCNIIPTEQSRMKVYGVLYRIAVAEKPKLDSAEGLGSGYEERTVTVSCNRELYDAYVYYATSIDDALKPYTWYKALVVAGAKEHGLPAEYVARLVATEAIEDQDGERHAKKMAIVDGSTEMTR